MTAESADHRVPCADQIIRRLRLRHVVHYSAGRHYRSPRQAEGFLEAIPGILAEFEGCDVILYQAGAEHLEDPLGRWLTTAQLARHDRIVFQTARDGGAGRLEPRRRLPEPAAQGARHP
ncbi:MAG: hypothetical protein AB1773_13475 [Pseudomonadota bacterium]